MFTAKNLTTMVNTLEDLFFLYVLGSKLLIGDGHPTFNRDFLYIIGTYIKLYYIYGWWPFWLLYTPSLNNISPLREMLGRESPSPLMFFFNFIFTFPLLCSRRVLPALGPKVVSTTFPGVDLLRCQWTPWNWLTLHAREHEQWKKTWLVGLYKGWNPTQSRWWFQRFVIFNPIWGRFPFWLIFFKGMKPPTR